MKSIKRGNKLITMMLFIFLVGMGLLIYKIQSEASFYISRSGVRNLGYIYDCNGEILFDDNAESGSYESGHFKDVGNFIGDASGQMTNTLVAKNMEKLSNYSFTSGIQNKGGKAAIYSTLDHSANEKVYTAFGGKNGCAIAYNYKTGEIYVCVSRPSVDPLKGYENLEEGSLLCKAFYKTVPGSMQKISTTIAAVESMGTDELESKSFSCSGSYTNKTGGKINCHNSYGHGTQGIYEGFANSCNPFFAQLVEDNAFRLDDIIETYRNMGYAVNGDKESRFSIDGIMCQKDSTDLEDKNDFNTQWGCMGQGTTMVSPCQMMMWQSAIVNETGEMTMPYLIDKVTNVRGRITEKAKTEYSDRLFSVTAAKEVKDIMLSNGENYSGKIPGFTVGVKSGTAQVKNGAEENSLLTGFDTDPDHPIAFCILIENRTSGEVSTDQIATVLLSSIK